MIDPSMLMNLFGSMPGQLTAAERERRRREEEERQRELALQGQLGQQPVAPAEVMPVPVPDVQQTSLAPQAMLPVSPVSAEDVERDQREQFLQQAQQAATPQPVAAATQAPALGTGLGMPTATQAAALMPTPAVAETQPTSLTTQFVTASDNQDRDALMRLSTDTRAPEWLRQQAADEAYQVMDQQRRTRDAERRVADAVASNDLSGLQREIRRSGDEGNIFRAVMYRALKLDDLAASEQQKLGAGQRWITARDNQGRPALIKTRADGLPITGYDETGAVLGEQDLLRYASAAAGGKITTAGQFFETPQGRLLRAQVDERGQTRMVDAATGDRYTGSTEGLRTVSEAGGIRRIDAGVIANLRQRFGTNAADALMELQKLVGPLTAEQQRQFFIEFGGTMQPPQAGAAAPAPTQAAPAPTQAAPAPTQAAPAPTQAAPAPTQAAPVRAAPSPVATQPRMQGSAPASAVSGRGQSLADIQSQRDQIKAERDATREVGTEERKEFVNKVVPDISDRGEAARRVSAARREQLDIIARNPTIINILSGDETQYGRARKLVVDLMSGAYGEEDTGKFREAVRNIGLSQPEQGALEAFASANFQINANTLKANAGAGAISNAEQKINREANIQNIEELTAYGALSGLNRSLFQSDLQSARQHYLETQSGLGTRREFNNAWGREERRAMQAYEGVLRARADFLSKTPAPAAGAGAAEQRAYRDRVFRAFELYPAPQFDPDSGSWNYGTANARQAAMAGIAGRR